MSHDPIERELARGSDLGVDPFFTARVLDALPVRPVGATLSPRRRLAVLAVAYGCAAVIAYLVVGLDGSPAVAELYTAVGTVVATAGASTLGQADGPFAVALAVVIPLLLLAVARLAARPHTDAA